VSHIHGHNSLDATPLGDSGNCGIEILVKWHSFID